MKRTAVPLSILAAALMFSAWPAAAYVGPGAGLSLLGALWAVVAAVGMSLMFIVLWPVRRLMRRRRAAPQQTTERQEPRVVTASREVGGNSD